MVEIKVLYEKTYMVTLADDIRKHYSKDVKNILLALINGTFICNRICDTSHFKSYIYNGASRLFANRLGFS